MEKETREIEKCVLVTENIYTINKDELMIIHALILESYNEHTCYSSDFLKLKSDVYEMIYSL